MFTYDSALSAEFDDRALVHLQIVISAKLRRGEAFIFSWRDDKVVGDGRTAVWLHPTIPLSYKYYGSRTPRINPEWVATLTKLANSESGLQLVAESNPTSGASGK